MGGSFFFFSRKNSDGFRLIDLIFIASDFIDERYWGKFSWGIIIHEADIILIVRLMGTIKTVNGAMDRMRLIYRNIFSDNLVNIQALLCNF